MMLFKSEPISKELKYSKSVNSMKTTTSIKIDAKPRNSLKLPERKKSVDITACSISILDENCTFTEIKLSPLGFSIPSKNFPVIPINPFQKNGAPKQRNSYSFSKNASFDNLNIKEQRRSLSEKWNQINVSQMSESFEKPLNKSVKGWITINNAPAIPNQPFKSKCKKINPLVFLKPHNNLRKSQGLTSDKIEIIEKTFKQKEIFLKKIENLVVDANLKEKGIIKKTKRRTKKALKAANVYEFAVSLDKFAKEGIKEYHVPAYEYCK
ncbi:unnamed protein product [Blepharisma stoltei]|uniref:Uncharacterized protein n=1 Tax=Blepharisma stoltei TaxID=1481888 RepID=A0AAU9J4H3_9CILI|nr:unnamed protein product [Blepharisma stoltei]